MLSSCCRFSKVRSRMVTLKAMRMFTDVYEKGKAEENVYFLKEQREKLRLLRKKMREIDHTLEESIKALEKATNTTTPKQKEPGKKA